MVQENLYEPLSIFQVRSPLLPLTAFSALAGDVTMSDSLGRLAQDALLREAIAVSSRSLFHSLHALDEETSERKRQQVMRGVFRYANRMITRATPYGLFAGVTVGSFGERTALRVQGVETFQKRTRPDMEWLTRVVQIWEQDPLVVRQLHVQTNSLVYRVGNRVQVAYSRDFDAEALGTGKSPSIRATWVVEMVLEAAQHWVSFERLVELIQQQDPQVPQQKVEHLLLVLCQQDFLITSLRLPLTNVQPFDHLRYVLGSVQGLLPLREKLDGIAERIRCYDEQPPGAGIDELHALVRDMRQLVDVKDVLQVDLQLQAEAVLPSELGHEVAKAAACLLRLAPPTEGYRHLESYRDAFLERYGTDREVSLLELLDEDRGLGAPATYDVPAGRFPAPPPSADRARRDQLLLRWVMECIRDGQQELVLGEEQVKKLAGREPVVEQLPSTLEVFVTLAASSLEAIDHGDYRIHMGRTASMMAGKSFGRFADLFGETYQQLAEEIQQREQKMSPDALFAELVHQPLVGRFMNVALSSHARTHEITLGAPSLKEEEHVIHLDDLMVGCTEVGFYLRSKRTGKRVIPTATHMLTVKSAPNVYRFLRELAFEGQRLFASFSWGSLAQMSYLPRLRYGKAILSSARWTLQREFLAILPKDVSFAEALQAYRTQWNMPRYVLLADTDLHLVLDLEHPLHVEELRRELAQLEDDESVVLYETELLESAVCLTGNQGEPYLAEFVFPLMLRQEVHVARAGVPMKQQPLEEMQKNRTHLPGGEWMYWKLYGNKAREDEFIGYELAAFCRQAREQGWAEQAFFIRYLDPEPHVRLRLRGAPEHLWSAMPAIHHVLRRWEEEGFLSKAMLDTYEPEIERYGGSQRMRAAEEVFAADSEMVMAWIGLFRAGRLSMTLEMLGVISLLDILSHFGLTDEQQLACLERRVDRSRYLNEFRAHRQEFLLLADASADRAGLRSHPNGEAVIDAMNRRSDAIRAYAACCSELAQRDSIIGSVIHMHLNRLLGIDRERERKVITLARHTLYQLQQQKAARHVETV